MNGLEKYRNLFGSIDSLADDVPWTVGVSNVVDWLTWSTGHLIGITKTAYWQMIVDWCDDAELRNLSTADKKLAIKKRLAKLVSTTEAPDRFSQPRDTIAAPREALRRIRYFSEDYLNKEFDICWSLVSDRYLDTLYESYFEFTHGGSWHSHGNGNYFAAGVGISLMQMDNLSYNPDAKLLVANELKLGGRKNPDQILKYASMFNELIKAELIEHDAAFGFLLFAGASDVADWDQSIALELRHCAKANKQHLLTPEIEATARATRFGVITWRELVTFNEKYTKNLGESATVERRLLEGFNWSLKRRHLVMGDSVVR